MSDHAHGGTTFENSGLKQPYHLVDPDPWPLVGALGGFLVVLGIIFAAHYGDYIVLAVGAVVVLTTMFFWWRDVIRESRTPGLHTPVVRLGLRYGMMFFITSEVMFFVAFFWAFFNFALFPDNISNLVNPVWPPPTIHTYDPFHIPVLNTMLLLLSGCTITWAHHSLIERDRKAMLTALALTIVLGLAFTTCQVVEYSHAPFKFVGGGVYPSVFFLATGFHGFHVIVGTCFLIVCWFRAKAGQFTPERHFGFEAAAWYWHFVDVVWLFLFTCIYWWGASAVVAAPDAAVPLLRAALRCRCPQCGKGPVFKGLLEVRNVCPVCGLDLRGHDAGDGAMVGVILVLGAIIVGLAFWVEMRFAPPLWVHAVLWPVVTIPLAILMMRPAKAALIAQQYRYRRSALAGQ